MSVIVVSPLARIGEMAVRHGCRDMLSLMAVGHTFHRPGVIAATRHLTLGLNDITFAGNDKLIAPAEEHVEEIVRFAHGWDRRTPLLVHCWMGVSRSPAAAAIVALTVAPDQDDETLADRLRAASPFATPNARLIAIGDSMLDRGGRLVRAMKRIGRGKDADGNTPFVFDPLPPPAILSPAPADRGVPADAT
ncbi:tyrosine phosphatase family protein [Rhizobium sp. Leaf341]|uniref:tyrosine phosphatase family protein n=1 Tax=Rhizobium sp. Leaf341 TaxID=1736344 RepID=UPI000715D985|nr:tyrosine phosphatase family protein [Rhizobium sp. Leaf341]KQR73295.1 protein tyrosine phosphatase [Rhizobium sp. Leaf341]